jgi:hypothetical protein
VDRRLLKTQARVRARKFANFSLELCPRALPGPAAPPTTKRKTRSIEDEPDINLAEWIDAPAESEADGGEAAFLYRP